MLCMAGCEYAAVERVNREAVLPVLRDLVRQPFFRYFKVSLYCDCPFWPDDGMCVLRDCSVCPCEDHEVPAPWKAADNGGPTPGCEGELASSNPLNLLLPCRGAKRAPFDKPSFSSFCTFLYTALRSAASMS